MPRRLAPLARLARFGSLAGRSILDLLYPPCCWLCEGAADPGGRLLCVGCRERIVPLPLERCPACAGSVDGLGVCADCFGAKLPFETVVAVGEFSGPLRELVHRLKFSGHWYLGRVLAELLAERVAGEVAPPVPSIVVPVPLVLGRSRLRGYNQAALIAAELARLLGLQHRPRALRRRGLLAARQATLDRHQRVRNVRGRFVARRPLPEGAQVLLVDDVVTTTRTVTESAQALRQAGASRVIVCTPARATLKRVGG